MAKHDLNAELARPTNGRHFETTEFEEWLDLDGALEALSPTRSTNLCFPSTPIKSVSPTETRHKVPFSVVKKQDTPPWSQLGCRKRKVARPTNEEDTGLIRWTGKKTSHNVIEKRYRSNLNDKIAILRDTVPALRFPTQRTTAKHGQSDTEASGEEDGATSKPKLNKATILTKATEYIKQLERQNERLLEETSVLRNRLHNADTPPDSVSTTLYEHVKSSDSPTTDSNSSPSGNQVMEDSSSSPTLPIGKIPVPDEFRRLRMGASTEHYAPEDDSGTSTRGRYMSRLLLGSLATLMVMEGLSEVESDRTSDKTSSRGLFALPQDLLQESRGFRDPIRRRIIAFVHSIQPHEAMSLVKLLFISIIVFVVVICIFDLGQRVLRLDRLSNPMQARKDTPPSFVCEDISNASRDMVHTQNLADVEELPVVMNIRGFFARQAIAILGHSWLQPISKDEEAAGLPSIRTEDFRRRWRAYAELLPKLLEESHGN
ncbi:hypothetical protein MMC13_003094 [Lambiella insularis]|nr:hypothetical protein [Lambiella insularis]